MYFTDLLDQAAELQRLTTQTLPLVQQSTLTDKYAKEELLRNIQIRSAGIAETVREQRKLTKKQEDAIVGWTRTVRRLLEQLQGSRSHGQEVQPKTTRRAT